MAQHCRSSQYSNMRPRYFLGRTIPEAAGIAAAAVCGYLMVQLTKGMTYGGQAGKMHLLLIFAAVALPLVIGFVFFMDGAEPYPRQVVGYLRRRTGALVRRVPGQVWARVRGAQARPGDRAVPALSVRTPAPPTDLTGRVIARLRRPRSLAEESR
jgi:hypothetical protein